MSDWQRREALGRWLTGIVVAEAAAARRSALRAHPKPRSAGAGNAARRKGIAAALGLLARVVIGSGSVH